MWTQCETSACFDANKPDIWEELMEENRLTFLSQHSHHFTVELYDIFF